MFYLRTGGNGSCKTLFTLRDVRDLQLKTGRPVAHNGRFKIYPHIQEDFGWKTIDFKNWWDEPDGTIFLIDEAYHDLPVRPNGQQPPLHIARLAEHRARGFDFYFLCLHPSQIDSFVRKAIQAPGYHQHLKRVGGATKLTRVLQWDSVNEQCQKDGSGKNAQIENRLQPKEVYEWYDSAFIHTGKVRIPKQLYWLVGAVLVVAVAAYFAIAALQKNVFKGQPLPGAPGSAVVASRPAGQSGPSGPAPPPDKPKVLTTAEYVAAYQPRISTLMHTAPAYDDLTKPRRVPLPAACVLMRSKGCKCFTQDGTPYATDQALCLSIVRDGMFIAFSDGLYPAPAGRAAAAAAVAEPRLAGGPIPGSAAPEPIPEPLVSASAVHDGSVLLAMRSRK